MNTLCSLLEGVGPAASMCNKEIFKAAKSCMTDRVLSVRASAAKCLDALVEYYVPLYSNDLEATVNVCLRCLDGSNYAVRLETSKLIGHILAQSQQQLHVNSSNTSLSASTTSGVSVTSNNSSRTKLISLKDALSLLASGFLRGSGRFLKGTSATDMIKGTSSVNREIRLGVTYAYIEFVVLMGSQWFETNIVTIVSHCISLLENPRAIPTHAEAIFARQCVGYILGTLFRRLLSEPVQLVVARELIVLVRQRLQNASLPEQLEEGVGENGVIDSTVELESKPVGLDSADVDEETNVTGSGDSVTKSFDLDSSVIRRGFGRGSTRTQRQQQQQHVLICALDQITQLVRWLDSIAAPLLDQPSQLHELLYSALSHPIAAVRLSAANCLRQVTIVQQAQRSRGDTILGYSMAIAGILAGNNIGALGIPSSTTKQVFSLAEDLLRAANQNSRLTLPRTQAGWMLLAAYMSLGPDLVKAHLPRMLLFWRNAFPRSIRELEVEKQRGDAFTWQVMLEARAGALCSVQSFLEYCTPTLVTEEAVSRLLAPIECALSMLAHLLDIVRIYGNHLKATASLIRHRLYRVLLLLSNCLQNTLLRELVAEFTLTDNPVNTTTSLLRYLCRTEDSVTLGSWIPDTDHKILEEQVQPNMVGTPDALEHDPAFLFLRDGLVGTVISATFPSDGISDEQDLEASPVCSPSTSFTDHTHLMLGPASSRAAIPTSYSQLSPGSYHLSASCIVQLGGPPPIGVAVIDSAVELFGRVFPCVPIRHRAQMIDHFAECIRLAKSTRQEAVQINVFTALLGAMRRLAETKTAFGDDPELRKSTTNLIMAALASPSVLLRCTSGECLGRLAQVIAEPNFLAELAQQIFDRLRIVRNPLSRAGHCLAVGCLHRYVGGLASGQHLSTSVGVLLAIAQDSSVPEVQVWALHALALVADSGGPMFREFVEPSLNLVLQLLLRSPTAMSEIQRSLGRLLSALITTLGPELQGTGGPITITRHSCFLCCLIMQDSTDPLLQAEAVSCLQRLHMFAPQQAQLPGLVPELQTYLCSPHLLLRRAAASYLRQLSQKGTSNLQEPIHNLECPDFGVTPALLNCLSTEQKEKLNETVLELQLFGRLDVENDAQTRRDIEETILCLLQTSAHSRLSCWLSTLKEVLQAASAEKSSRSTIARQQEQLKLVNDTQSDTVSVHSTGSHDPVPNGLCSAHEEAVSEGWKRQTLGGDEDDNDDDGGVDASLGGTGQTELNAVVISGVKPRWPTRLFAIGCVRILLITCAKLAQLAIATPSSQTTLIRLSTTHEHSNEHSIDTNAVAHFDLALARCLRDSKTSSSEITDWLVLYLTDLVRIAFMSATSDSEHLRLAGLRLMQDVIQRFACVADPDFPGHIILEQYQAQVSAALRPAFVQPTAPLVSADDPLRTSSAITQSINSVQPSPELTAAACLACSTWIGSGVARDVQDLQRVHELLRQAFDRLHFDELETPTRSPSARKRTCTSDRTVQLYSDDAVTMEKLAVLRAWADVYIVTMTYASYSVPTKGGIRNGDECEGSEIRVDEAGIDFSDEESTGAVKEVLDAIDAPFWMPKRNSQCCHRSYQLLSDLVHPVLHILSRAWIAVLKDFALLNLPEELSSQRPANGGIFFGPDANLDRVRLYYAQHWSTILSAVSVWVQHELSGQTAQIDSNSRHEEMFNLLLGVCVGALCDPTAKQSAHVVNTCLRSLNCLLSRSAIRSLLTHIMPVTPLELLHVIYRTLLTRDSVESHLLCLNVVNCVLTAAEEHLVKQREVWLSADSSNAQPKVLLASESVSKSTSLNMTSSISLQTSNLVDTDVYELAEGGTLWKFNEKVTHASQTDPNTIKPPPLLGLQPGKSVVFACLEIVVCTLARYSPSLINQLAVYQLTDTSGEKRSPDRNYIVPETACSNSHNAPCVLASAIRCLLSVPDLCAPRVLLSGFNVIGTSSETGNPGPQCFDNLLLVLLDILVNTAQVMLLLPFTSSPPSVNGNPKYGIRHRFDQADLTDIQGWMAHNALTLCGLNGDDVEITSTATSAQFASAARRQRREQAQQRYHIDTLVGWTWQQSQLADALACLGVRLATHHYPTLTNPRLADNSVCSRANDDSRVDAHRGGTSQPDSSEIRSIEQTNQSTCVDTTLCASNPAPANDWYGQIAFSMLRLLQYEKMRQNESRIPNCYLATITLISRVAAQCPLPVFESKELRNSIVDQICHAWTQAAMLPSDCTDHCTESYTTPSCDLMDSVDRPRGALFGLKGRRVCLAAIGLLVNHREPAVNAFFIRTLTPQIFRWIYDLSLLEKVQPVTDQNKYQVAKDELSECLHAAIDILESLIDIANSSSRQGLLLILVPLLCNLLLPSPPSNNLISRWYSAHTISAGSAELSCGLHLTTIQHLISIAPRFPAEFRSIFGALGELRPRLEMAIKSSATVYHGDSKTAVMSLKTSATRTTGRPVIQLKTDFSDFTKS
ncbi:hypothetical protein EG68_06925 [Paragonimus skrjabini miyazakii]|uniref:HEAT repeat-containing protein 5B n=1 Tax=Paragonimus skrjabini miyazakii TaxID=59628 RepID=A0A8S9Y9T2_9TREM|nr:hypothetical protein EG68_06925 [Paragonimus skrjabini miyazakii]